MKERLEYVDIAKGILIILVVIGHIWQAGFIHNVIYSFHMPAFFVISGILMNHTGAYKKGYFQFVRGLLFSFGIPFLFIDFLGVLTDIVRHGVTLNIKGYVFNTLTLTYNDHNLWFLVDLFLVEAVFVAVIKCVRRDWMVCLICLLLFFISFFVPGGNKYVSTVTGSFRYLLFFTGGFYGRDILAKKNLMLTGLSLFTILAVSLIWGRRESNSLSVEYLCFLASGFTGTYLVLQAGMAGVPGMVREILRYSGRNTIIIYGTHHIIYAVAGKLLGVEDYGKTPLVVGIIMLAIVAVLEIPVIYCINRWAPFLAGRKKKTRKKIL